MRPSGTALVNLTYCRWRCVVYKTKETVKHITRSEYIPRTSNMSKIHIDRPVKIPLNLNLLLPLEWENKGAIKFRTNIFLT